MKGITTMRYIPTKEQFKARTTSMKAWRLPKQKSALAPDHVWTNEDMDPVKIENQTWTLWTWMAYWATDTINLGTWETASSILAVGLSWREAIPVKAPKIPLKMPKLITYLDHRCWHILCCHSHGSQRCNWCETPYPLFRRHSSLLRVLLRILLYHLSMHLGNVLAWNSGCKRSTMYYDYDYRDLAIIREYQESHCRGSRNHHTGYDKVRSPRLLRFNHASNVPLVISCSGSSNYPSCSSHPPNSATSSPPSSLRRQSLLWQRWDGASTRQAEAVRSSLSNPPSPAVQKPTSGSPACRPSPDPGQHWPVTSPTSRVMPAPPGANSSNSPSCQSSSPSAPSLVLCPLPPLV